MCLNTTSPTAYRGAGGVNTNNDNPILNGEQRAHLSMTSSTDLSLSPDYLSDYRKQPAEVARVADLMGLIPSGLSNGLDIGAREGHISREILKKVDSVTALDLEKPQFSCPGIVCVKGDATALQFADKSFDLVFCAEVLEHIPRPALESACVELARVANKYVLVGVPYKQDIREAKTTCYSCGTINPPWAHVNSFDEHALAALFPSMKIVATSFVGAGTPRTNALSSALMTYAGNPYGTYIQQEGCTACGRRLIFPPPRSFTQKVATKAAVWLNRAQSTFYRRRGNWIHVLFEAS
jgi:hypothetical protein